MTDDGREPDYRMSLAAERTYLAYLRTGLALVAAGVAVAGALPHAGAPGLRRITGVVFVLVGAAVIACGRQRLRAVQRAMRHGAPLPPTSFIEAVGWALLLLCVAAVVIALAA